MDDGLLWGVSVLSKDTWPGTEPPTFRFVHDSSDDLFTPEPRLTSVSHLKFNWILFIAQYQVIFM